ncbi:MAG: hypothetical protein UY48_C0009G0022 [Candidatus Gottesmanbacteria bacterium GW2011_GWB1_49_7]|uniref:Uncharacterized protein n=1 Tax=Candidatus Gottesmanbacteria bacterium GW2011_GWB1_49_7 TaxID=1618448 RepID=A0A0G1Z226_9BACT|nr:MAG: hypothetical protein UY48_C0009G0022 [Candidatus Gottesmanbacteria bacterium GW2011_GWB1_49_7]
MRNSTIVWCAPEADPIELAHIKSELEKAKGDPEHIVVVGSALHWVEVPVGAVISVFKPGGIKAQKQEVDSVKTELEKGLKDPSYVAVVPYSINWTEFASHVRCPPPCGKCDK